MPKEGFAGVLLMTDIGLASFHFCAHVLTSRVCWLVGLFVLVGLLIVLHPIVAVVRPYVDLRHCCGLQYHHHRLMLIADDQSDLVDHTKTLMPASNSTA